MEEDCEQRRKKKLEAEITRGGRTRGMEARAAENVKNA